MITLEASDATALAAALAGGAVLGGIYFGGLWLTVRRLAGGQSRAAALLLLSFGLRSAIVLLGFYAIVDGGHWDRLLTALIGFIAVRVVLVRRLKPVQGMVSPARKRAPS